jgi:hypothetical protein
VEVIKGNKQLVNFEVLAEYLFAILWDLAPFSPYVNQRFGGRYQSFDPEGEGHTRPPKRWFIYRLHGAISQKVTFKKIVFTHSFALNECPKRGLIGPSSLMFRNLFFESEPLGQLILSLSQPALC